MDDVQNDLGDGSQAQNAEALIDEIRELLRRENLDEALTLFDRLHPADQGDLLVDLPEETRQDIIGEMTYQATAEIFEYIDPDEAVQVAAPITPRLLADILNEADPDVAADVLRGIPRRPDCSDSRGNDGEPRDHSPTGVCGRHRRRPHEPGIPRRESQPDGCAGPGRYSHPRPGRRGDQLRTGGG